MYSGGVFECLILCDEIFDDILLYWLMNIVMLVV